MEDIGNEGQMPTPPNEAGIIACPFHSLVAGLKPGSPCEAFIKLYYQEFCTY